MYLHVLAIPSVRVYAYMKFMSILSHKNLDNFSSGIFLVINLPTTNNAKMKRWKRQNYSEITKIKLN